MSDQTTSLSLGDRMKRNYEDRTRIMLPRRTYTILRIDGRSFHSYTRHCDRPFDEGLSAQMDAAAIALCEDMQGTRLAYGQSDEYSFLVTDFSSNLSEAWFDGNLQKICSIAASAFTAHFNARREKPAMFDCRVFTIPDPIEVENYFIWRQQDAVRNSIQMVGQEIFSPKQLHGVSCDGIQEKLFREKGINWNDTPVRFKRGRCCVFKDMAGWSVDVEPPTFTEDREYLIRRIPQLETRPTTECPSLDIAEEA